MLRAGLVALAVLAMISAPAAAQPLRYVSTQGSDLVDGLSPGSAWRTLDHAAVAAPTGATIHVAAGTYVENSSSLGYLRLGAGLAGRSFVADGPVTLRAAVPSGRVLLLTGGADWRLQGIAFDGEGHAVRLVEGTPATLRLESCQFAGSTERAAELSYVTDLQIVDCDFGTAAAPLPSVALWLTSCPGLLLADNRFFVAGQRVASVDVCAGATIDGNAFGSEAAPLDLGSHWALYVVNSDQPQILGNAFTLLSGYGIGVLTGYLDVSNVLIESNTIRCTAPTESYALRVGSETAMAATVSGVSVLNNTLDLAIPPGDSAKHDLFVGHVGSPVIAGNTVTGGGYGIAIKYATDADVHDNVISGTRRWGVVDKAGLNCRVHDNRIDVDLNHAVRLTNEYGGGQHIAGGSWYRNTFTGDAIPYELSPPVTPAENALWSDSNVFEIAHGSDPVLTIWEVDYDFWQARALWGWDIHSGIDVTAEPPSPVSDSLAVQFTDAALTLSASELCTGWLAYGATSLDDTLRVTAESMTLRFTMDALAPDSDYGYRYALVDRSGEEYLSPEGSFHTATLTAADPPLAEGALTLGAPYPNPGQPGCWFTVAGDAREPLELELLAVDGRRVRTLHAGPLGASQRSFRLDGRDEHGHALASGVYLLRARAGGEVATRRWVLLR